MVSAPWFYLGSTGKLIYTDDHTFTDSYFLDSGMACDQTHLWIKCWDGALKKGPCSVWGVGCRMWEVGWFGMVPWVRTGPGKCWQDEWVQHSVTHFLREHRDHIQRDLWRASEGNTNCTAGKASWGTLRSFILAVFHSLGLRAASSTACTSPLSTWVGEYLLKQVHRH